MENVYEQAWKDYLESLAAALPAERRVLARRGWAGENRSLFEHPAWCAPVIPNVPNNDISACTQSFPVAAVREARAKGMVHDG